MSVNALFLDRDGIINKDIGKYVTAWDEIVFLEELFYIAKLAIVKSYKIIIITNQAGISRGLQTLKQVNEIHARISEEFKKRDCPIEKIFFCPHHPDYSKCFCRKPGTLYFEKGISLFQIAPEKSLMIGDNERDIFPASCLKINTLFIGKQNIDYATHCSPSLRDAIPFIEQFFGV